MQLASRKVLHPCNIRRRALIFSTPGQSDHAQDGTDTCPAYLEFAQDGTYTCLAYLESAGGQFMRAVVERCQGTEANGRPRMHTLVTMGGQHQVGWCHCLPRVPTEAALLP